MNHHFFKLFLCAALFNAASGDLFFYSDEIQIHASKNVSIFQNSTDSVLKILDELENAREKIPTLKQKAMKKNEIRNSEEVGNLKTLFGNLQQSIDAKIATCINEIDSTLYNAKKNFYDVIPKKNLSRNKRAPSIPLFGELWAAIGGNPSPSEWEDQKNLNRDMKIAVNSEKIEVAHIEHVLDDHSKIFNETFESLKNINHDFTFMEESVGSALILLDFNMKIDAVCSNGRYSANYLLHETEIMQSIRDNALDSKPDRNLFPPQKIKAEIEKYKQTNKKTAPYFSNNFEFSQLYSIRSATTVFHRNVIHSRMNLPLIDQTLRYQFVEFPNLSNEDLETISMLEKIAMKKLNIYACNDQLRSVILFSEQDMRSCKQLPQGSHYLCRGREIHQTSGVNPCANHKLPKVLALELKQDLILLKTDEKEIKVECDGSSYKFKVKTTFSKIKLGLNCSLHGEHFRVGKYSKISKVEMETKPISEAKIYEIPDFKEPKMTHFYNISNQLGNVSQLLGNQANEIKEVKAAHQETENNVKQVNDDVTEMKHPSHMSIITQVLFGFIIGIIIACVVIFYIYFRCHKKPKNTNLNLSVSTPSGQVAETSI